MKKKFLRSKWRTYSKLGKRRKKKQKWRKPKGRDTKMRLMKKGNPKLVKIGYKKQKKAEDIKRVCNLNDLEKLAKGKKVLLGRIGKKKKIEIVKKAKAREIKIINLNVDKFLKSLEGEKKKKEEEKEKKKIKEEGRGKKKETEKKRKEKEEKKKTKGKEK